MHLFFLRYNNRVKIEQENNQIEEVPYNEWYNHLVQGT